MKKNISKHRTAIVSVTVDHAVPYHDLLVRRLVENDWEVHFISSGGEHLRNLDSRVIQHEIEMARQPDILKDLKSAIGWARVIRAINPDLVVAGTPKASMLGMLISRIFGVSTRIYWVHGLRLETAKGLFLKFLLVLEKFTSKNATHLISVSRSLSDRLVELKIAPPQKIQLIGEGSTQGVDLRKFKPVGSGAAKRMLTESLGLLPDVPVVGFVGRLTLDKGIRELQQALISLKTNGYSFQVLFVGEFEDEESAELVLQLEQLGVFTVKTGLVSETSDYYQVMDIFCLPSYREGLPNVVLEAFASGVPVVGTNVTGISDLIADRKTGLLVTAGDHTELQLAIESLFANTELATQIASNGLEYVRKNFDSEIVVEQQEKFLKSVMNEEKPKRKSLRKAWNRS
ncbi:glycosyltransferase family 4 protein [Corynebacterium glutamicum]|uniref:glycosyltransferase family 4 protein n=1 Tax=Corynebacterium glutamicum TaxID=1718 RepID=UPI003C7DC094